MFWNVGGMHPAWGAVNAFNLSRISVLVVRQNSTAEMTFSGKNILSPGNCLRKQLILFSMYCRRYGTKCSGCGQGIAPSDLVRRQRDKVFHLNCFTCCVCRKQLSTGEHLYVLDDNRFMCKDDYTQMKAAGPPSSLTGKSTIYIPKCLTWDKVNPLCENMEVTQPMGRCPDVIVARGKRLEPPYHPDATTAHERFCRIYAIFFTLQSDSPTPHSKKLSTPFSPLIYGIFTHRKYLRLCPCFIWLEDLSFHFVWLCALLRRFWGGWKFSVMANFKTMYSKSNSTCEFKVSRSIFAIAGRRYQTSPIRMGVFEDWFSYTSFVNRVVKSYIMDVLCILYHILYNFESFNMWNKSW